MARPRLSSRASAYLEQALDGLLDGTRTLETIPPEVAAIYFAGFAHGQEAGARDLDQVRAALASAEDAANYYFERWNNPDKQLADMKQRRIDDALDARAAELGRMLTGVEIVETAVAACAPIRGPRAA